MCYFPSGEKIRSISVTHAVFNWEPITSTNIKCKNRNLIYTVQLKTSIIQRYSYTCCKYPDHVCRDLADVTVSECCMMFEDVFGWKHSEFCPFFLLFSGILFKNKETNWAGSCQTQLHYYSWSLMQLPNPLFEPRCVGCLLTAII